MQHRLNFIALVTIQLAMGAVAFAESMSPISLAVKTLNVRHSPVEPLELIVIAKNISTSLSVSLTTIEIEVPVELAIEAASDNAASEAGSTPGGEPADSRMQLHGGLTRISVPVGEDLDPGETLEKVVAVPLDRRIVVSRGRQWQPQHLRWLFLPAGDFTFRAVLIYQDENSSEFRTTSELPVHFNPPLSVLMIGALSGALLLGVLKTWSLLLMWRNDRVLTFSRGFGQILAFLLLELPVAMLTAFIAIIVAHISMQFRGVLAIELNDIWAGFLVGLLAQSTTGPVADALAKYLPGVQNPLKAGPTPGAAAGPVSAAPAQPVPASPAA